jgi:tetratricopeptide (TPR) repeat protein
MHDPYHRLTCSFNQIKQRMPSLKTIEQNAFSVLAIIIIIATLIFIAGVAFWIFEKEDAIIIQPFETLGMGANFDGKPLATLLNFDLQKIKNINEPLETTVGAKSSGGNMIIPRPIEDFYMPPTIPNRNPLEYSLAQISTTGLGGTSISIGNLLLSLKDLFGTKANTITCSLQRYNSTIIVVAILDDHHSSKEDIMTFDSKVNTSNGDQIPLLINDLAFKISLELGKRWAQSKEDYLYPRSWQTFKNMTQGLEAYNNYMITKDSKYLDRGKYMALLARNSEPGYKGSFNLLSNLGFAYLVNGKYDEAANIFQNITEFKPFDSALGLGLVYGMQGDYVKALNAFDNATQLNPQNAYAWNYKGIILSKQRNYREAIEAFNNATRLDSEFALAWNDKGNALAHSGKYNESIQAYDKAIELNPQYSEAWDNKGAALYNLGMYDKSVNAYNKAIQIDPNNSNALIYKAIALEKLNKTQSSAF